MNQDLLNAVQDRIRLGYSESDIIKELTDAGYTVTDAMNAYQVAVSNGVADNSAQVIATPDLGSASISKTLISFEELFSAGFRVVETNWSLIFKIIGLIFVAILAIGVLGVVLYQFLPIFVTIALLTVVIILLMISINPTIQRALMFRNSHESLSYHLSYVIKNLVPILVTTAILGLVINIGFMLFVVPGFIAVVFFGFAQLYLVRGDHRYFSALTASYKLVKGRFWSVALRIFGTSIASGLIVLTLYYIAEVTSGSMALFFGLVSLIVAVLGSLWVMACYVVLFESLEASR